MKEMETTSGTALPQGSVLAYLTTGATPTRVRIISSRAVLIVGIIYLLLGTLALWAVIDDMVYLVPRAPKYIGPGSIPRLIEFALEEEEPFPIFFLTGIVSGVVLAIASGPVKRGRKAASLISAVSLLPLAFILFMLSLGLVGQAVFIGFGIGLPKGQAQPVYFLLLLPATLAVVLLLLSKDIAACLFWISKNPVTEKSPVPFLPLKAADGTMNRIESLDATRNQSPTLGGKS